MIVPCIILAAAGAIAVKATPFDEQNKEAMIDYMDSHQQLFEVDYFGAIVIKNSWSPTMSYGDFKSRLMDAKYLDSEEDNLLRKAPSRLMAMQDNTVIPESFDARQNWSECESIKLFRNQGNCGSCWAVAVASVMSDRLCIASGQRIQTILSSTDIISCCDECPALPCNGAQSIYAWEYIKSQGVCSGGPYGSKGVCKPYVFHPCDRVCLVTMLDEETKSNILFFQPNSYSEEVVMEKDGPCNSNKTSPKPMCLNKCMQDYAKNYTEDLVYGDYYQVPNDEREIQKEIMLNGPVQAKMAVYDDFINYHPGEIYFHKYNKTKDGKPNTHAVKIIGWGVEKRRDVKNRTILWKYWLISNSWGADWGEDGLFRIVRGVPFNCNIESFVIAARPKIH